MNCSQEMMPVICSLEPALIVRYIWLASNFSFYWPAITGFADDTE